MVASWQACGSFHALRALREGEGPPAPSLLRRLDGERANSTRARQSAPTAGRELLFYYGSMCHESWINLYGFAPPDARPCPKPKATATAKGKAGSKINMKMQGKKLLTPMATKNAGVKLLPGKS